MPPKKKRNKNRGRTGSHSGNTDRLSDLPDALIISILSFLPVKDSARTSVLSTRWRRLWTQTPLDVDDFSLWPRAILPGDNYKESISRLRDIIDQIISTHAVHIHTFRISHDFSQLGSGTVDRWVETPTQTGIRKLVLLANRHYVPPRCLLTCKSLHALELSICSFPPPPLPCPIFVGLTELKLSHIRLTDDTVHDLLSNCSSLASLDLVSCTGLHRLCIRSSSLCSLMLTGGLMSAEVKELSVEDAPSLERLRLGDSITRLVHVRVIASPKLRLLGIIHAAIENLKIGNTWFKGKRLILVSTLMHSLKTLAIEVDLSVYHQEKMVPSLLKCFPCLETLDVLILDLYKESAQNWMFWKQQGSFDCLGLHLKSVKLIGFRGCRTHLGFAKFLIAKARMLKELKLFCRIHPWKDEWAESIRRKLSVGQIASSDAQIVFMKSKSRYDGCSTWKSLLD